MSTDESIKDIIFRGFLALQKMKGVPVNVKHRMLGNLISMSKDTWKVVGITQAALEKFVENDFEHLTNQFGQNQLNGDFRENPSVKSTYKAT